jgi:ribonuclease H2 subunit A
MFDAIKSHKDIMGFAYNALSPQDLSAWMLQREKYNLNAIAHDTTISLIRKALLSNVNVKQVILLRFRFHDFLDKTMFYKC